MSVLLTDMVSSVRVRSGLRSNPLFSDQKIADMLNDSKSKLRDIFIASLSHWFRKAYRFTLSGGIHGSTLDLSLIPDLQMDQYLNRNPDSVNPEPVTKLGSIAERTFGNGIPPGWVGGRKYDCDGDILTVYPRDNSSGDYELVYTDMGKRFAFPVTVEFDIDTADIGLVPPPGGLDGDGAWLLANGFNGIDDLDTIPDDGGFDLILTFGSPNGAFSGTYNVVSVGKPPQFGSPTFGCQLASTAGYTNPASGTGSYTYQPVGTRDDLEQILTPWVNYMVLDTSIAIRASRRQPVDDLERQFTSEEGRAIKMAKRRSEGVKQAPMTHNRLRRRGYSYGAP